MRPHLEHCIHFSLYIEEHDCKTVWFWVRKLTVIMGAQCANPLAFPLTTPPNRSVSGLLTGWQRENKFDCWWNLLLLGHSDLNKGYRCSLFKWEVNVPQKKIIRSLHCKSIVVCCCWGRKISLAIWPIFIDNEKQYCFALEIGSSGEKSYLSSRHPDMILS